MLEMWGAKTERLKMLSLARELPQAQEVCMRGWIAYLWTIAAVRRTGTSAAGKDQGRAADTSGCGAMSFLGGDWPRGPEMRKITPCICFQESRCLKGSRRAIFAFKPITRGKSKISYKEAPRKAHTGEW
jgi:hypothetical protein